MGNYRDYEDKGRSRAKGQSRGRAGSARTGGESGSYGSRASSGSGRYGNYKRGRKKPSKAPLVGGTVVVLALIAAGAVAVQGGLLKGSIEEISQTVETTTYYNPNLIHEDVYLDYSALAPSAELLNLKGMNEQQVVEKLKGSYSWNLLVKNENPNLDKFRMPSLPEQKPEENTENPAAVDNEGTEEIVKVENPLDAVQIRPEKGQYSVPDLLSENIETLVSKIFEDYKAKASVETTEESTEETTAEKKGFFSFGAKKETESSTETESSVTEIHADYVLELPDFSEKLKDIAEQLAIVWNMEPENGDITSFDPQSGEFVFGGTVDGYQINAEATAEKLIQAVQERAFDQSIAAEGKKLTASSDSIRGKYKTIISFTTNTTSNEVRNQNVKLAAQAVNGTVLKPGEEFSFNDVVGKRTPEKGYGAAAAYNAGEVVQEVGGGVCQVSSTLYNAVFRAGLTTTYRRSHTFAPNYVRPGSDATISWGGPDYRFVNNSKHAIGIRSWYKDQTCTVQIYGIPVLPEGESWDLVTEKVEDLPLAAPQIITPEQGSESKGTTGSRWVAYKVIKKNGTEEKVQDHKVTYKGHTPKKYAAAAVPDTTAAESSAVESTAAESVAAEPTEAPKESTKAAERAVSPKSTVSEDPGEISAHPGPAEGDSHNDRGPGADDEGESDVIPGGPGV